MTLGSGSHALAKYDRARLKINEPRAVPLICCSSPDNLELPRSADARLRFCWVHHNERDKKSCSTRETHES